VFGTNAGATKEPGEPDHAGNPGGTSVWYRWQAPTNGDMTFTTFGSNFDTLLAIYTGSGVNGLTPITSSDDEGLGLLTSRVVFAATAGTTYQIAVDGFGGATGSIHLGWSLNTAIFNSRLAAQVRSDGRFNMGAFPDAAGGAGPDSWDLMFSWPFEPGPHFQL